MYGEIQCAKYIKKGEKEVPTQCEEIGVFAIVVPAANVPITYVVWVCEKHCNEYQLLTRR